MYVCDWFQFVELIGSIDKVYYFVNYLNVNFPIILISKDYSQTFKGKVYDGACVFNLWTCLCYINKRESQRIWLGNIIENIFQPFD